MILSERDLLLSAAVMRSAEQAAMQAGISGWQMMERAGHSSAAIIQQYFDRKPVTVLCGPGNNGGDGWVIAESLRAAGWPVTVLSMVEKSSLSGDAATAAGQYHGEVWPLSVARLAEEGLFVDALFGTGLTRPLEDGAHEVIAALAARGAQVVAIDIPSGIHSDNGAVMGVAAQADMTITFGAKKIGHAMLPGRGYCGSVMVADIGIGAHIMAQRGETPLENSAALWTSELPHAVPSTHKYTRGAALVRGGEAHSTGASRLAAMAALRVGAGAVTIACTPDTLPIYAASCTAVMTKPYDTVDAFQRAFEDGKLRAALIGPGNGVNDATREAVFAALSVGKALVLDADALSVFSGKEAELFQTISSTVIMTPHQGEFERMFSAVEGTDKVSRTQGAAKASRSIVIHKGADTVIAAPDGRVVINTHAPATLATAGSGDVLAGLITGLLAQGMEPFAAACAAVWMHGEAATLFGEGLIAEDLPEMIPGVLQRLG